MKIAFIVPKIINRGPVIVVKDLIGKIADKVDLIDVYYFDISEESLPMCNCYKISFFDKIDFDKYDIIHTHMLRPDLYVRYHKKSIKRATVISTIHQDIYQNLSDSYNRLIGYFFEKIWLSCLRSFDRVVYLTNQMRLKYEYRIGKNKGRVIYNGRNIDVNREEVDINDSAEILKLKSIYKIIGVSALLTKRKGIIQLIKALPLLNDCAMLIIGDGPDKQDLIKEAKELNVIDRCLFLGYRDKAFRYYKYFDIYGMSSYSEGFPLALLEAAQYKIPTVCSDIEIFKELFTPHEVVFFTVDDTLSLQQAITKVLESPEFYGENIYTKVNMAYSANRMSQDYLSLYEESRK